MLDRLTFRLRPARAALDELLEQARQAGYDAGYEDGVTVRPVVIQLPRSGLSSRSATQ